MSTYFGYVIWNGIVSSQKWDGELPNKLVIQTHKLSEDEFNLDLRVLERKYPFKEIPELQ